MGRHEKNDVDYFPFYCKEGKTMHVIESKYRNDGFACWVKILRQLATTDFHYLDLRDELDILYLASKCLVEQETLIGILDILAKFNEIDTELWTKHRIVWNQKFVDSINDAYSKRRNKPLLRESLFNKLHLNAGGNADKQDINTQSKVKESKVNKSIENNSTDIAIAETSKMNLETLFYPHNTPEYRESFAEMVKVRFKKKSQEQLQRMLDKVKNFDEQTGIDIFSDNFINDKWKGFIVKDSYLNRNGANLTPKPSPMDKILADAQAGMMITNNTFNP